MQTPWMAANPAHFNSAQQALSDRMQAYWGSFARSGEPTSDKATPWPMDDGRGPLRLSPTEIVVKADFASEHRCAFWTALERNRI